jgi:hypothetical protein
VSAGHCFGWAGNGFKVEPEKSRGVISFRAIMGNVRAAPSARVARHVGTRRARQAKLIGLEFQGREKLRSRQTHAHVTVVPLGGGSNR